MLQLQTFMAKSFDFATRKWVGDTRNIKSVIEKNFGFPILIEDAGYLHMLDYLFRTNITHSDDLEYVRTTALYIISSLYGYQPRRGGLRSLILYLLWKRCLFSLFALQNFILCSFQM